MIGDWVKPSMAYPVAMKSPLTPGAQSMNGRPLGRTGLSPPGLLVLHLEGVAYSNGFRYGCRANHFQLLSVRHDGGDLWSELGDYGLERRKPWNERPEPLVPSLLNIREHGFLEKVFCVVKSHASDRALLAQEGCESGKIHLVLICIVIIASPRAAPTTLLELINVLKDRA